MRYDWNGSDDSTVVSTEKNGSVGMCGMFFAFLQRKVDDWLRRYSQNIVIISVSAPQFTTRSLGRAV